MNSFIRGMDISSYLEMVDKQYEYFDYDGKKSIYFLLQRSRDLIM